MVISILAVVLLLTLVAALPTWRQIKGLRTALQQPEPDSKAAQYRNSSEYGTNVPFWLQRRR